MKIGMECWAITQAEAKEKISPNLWRKNLIQGKTVIHKEK